MIVFGCEVRQKDKKKIESQATMKRLRPFKRSQFFDSTNLHHAAYMVLREDEKAM
jgi:hypothetical protein